jgi:peroxiredoxin
LLLREWFNDFVGFRAIEMVRKPFIVIGAISLVASSVFAQEPVTPVPPSNPSATPATLDTPPPTTTTATPATEIALKLISAGASARMGGYAPVRIALTTDKPEEVKRLPKDMGKTLLYGSFRFGAKAKRSTVTLVLDGGTNAKPTADKPDTQKKDEKPARFLVDANGNGDFTDDAPVSWQTETYGTTGEFILHRAILSLPLGFGGTTGLVSVGIYQFDATDPQRKKHPNSLYVFRDYGLEGTATFAGKSYPVALDDMEARGEFTALGRVALLVDTNGDGKFGLRGERFEAEKPFNIGGVTYEIQSVDPLKGSLLIVPSKETVKEIKPAPDLNVGQSAPPFTADNTDGKTVTFPADYKGKLVLIHFWATWSTACVKEVPGLVKVYEAHRDKGLDVLSVSLDKSEARDKRINFAKEQRMFWSHIFDGAYWNSEVALLYGIDALPATLLVDGDTGLIIATGEQLRGKNLNPIVEAALAAKKASKEAPKETAPVAKPEPAQP